MDVQSSNELQRFDLKKMGHQVSSSSNGHQGDIPYCVCIIMDIVGIGSTRIKFVQSLAFSAEDHVLFQLTKKNKKLLSFDSIETWLNLRIQNGACI